MSKILYLSGPITGVDDYFERFQRAFLALEEAGYNVINPAPLYQVMPDDATYEADMHAPFSHGRCHRADAWMGEIMRMQQRAWLGDSIR